MCGMGRKKKKKRNDAQGTSLYSFARGRASLVRKFSWLFLFCLGLFLKNEDYEWFCCHRRQSVESKLIFVCGKYAS